jgi:hypothetical protein
MAIAIFANAAKGISALQLGRDLDVSYKTAFVLAHKLREAMAADQARYQPRGHVEIDGAYFGGHRKPANHKANRVDRRPAEHQTGKRKVVVVVRERQGRSLPFVVRAEDEGAPIVARRVLPGSTVYADEAPHWDALHARFAMHRINHSSATVRRQMLWDSEGSGLAEALAHLAAEVRRLGCDQPRCFRRARGRGSRVTLAKASCGVRGRWVLPAIVCNAVGGLGGFSQSRSTKVFHPVKR